MLVTFINDGKLKNIKLNSVIEIVSLQMRVHIHVCMKGNIMEICMHICIHETKYLYINIPVHASAYINVHTLISLLVSYMLKHLYRFVNI